IEDIIVNLYGPRTTRSVSFGSMCIGRGVLEIVVASDVFAAFPAVDSARDLARTMCQNRVVLDEKELIRPVIGIISPRAFSACSAGVGVLVELEREFAGPAFYDVVTRYPVRPTQNPNRIRVNLSKMTMIDAHLLCWRCRCSSAQMPRRHNTASRGSWRKRDSSDARSLRNVDVDNHRFRPAARRVVQDRGRIVNDGILRGAGDSCLSLKSDVLGDLDIARPIERAGRKRYGVAVLSRVVVQ